MAGWAIVAADAVAAAAAGMSCGPPIFSCGHGARTVSRIRQVVTFNT